MKKFWNAVVEAAESGSPGLLATVMAVSGSLHTAPGARMLVTETSAAGALDSGPTDSLILPKLRAGLNGGAYVERITVDQTLARRFAMHEGGAVDLLVQPLTAFAPGMLNSIATQVNAGGSVLVATALASADGSGPPGTPTLVEAEVKSSDLPAALLEAASGIAAGGKSVLWTGDDRTVFVDLVRPLDELIIFGASLVAEHICELAARSGFQVSVIAADPEVGERYPLAAEVVITDDPLATLTGRTFTPSDFVISLMTSQQYYLTAVQELLRQPVGFLGMIGSRGRVAGGIRTLKDQGFTDEELGRLHAPLGLNLNAETPFEIAVSIMAQLIQVRRGQTGLPSDWSLPPVAAMR